MASWGCSWPVRAWKISWVEPGDDPGRDHSTWQRVGLGLQSEDSVLATKVVQSRSESCPAEQPAYGVLGATGKNKKPECREGHRNDRILDPGSVEVHIRVGTIEGEQEKGWHQERPHNIPSDNASHAAVRGLKLPSPPLRPLAPSDTTPLYSTTASRALRGGVFLARGHSRLF
jgi:hypothetical protein